MDPDGFIIPMILRACRLPKWGVGGTDKIKQNRSEAADTVTFETGTSKVLLNRNL